MFVFCLFFFQINMFHAVSELKSEVYHDMAMLMISLISSVISVNGFKTCLIEKHEFDAEMLWILGFLKPKMHIQHI